MSNTISNFDSNSFDSFVKSVEDGTYNQGIQPDKKTQAENKKQLSSETGNFSATSIEKNSKTLNSATIEKTAENYFKQIKDAFEKETDPVEKLKYSERLDKLSEVMTKYQMQCIQKINGIAPKAFNELGNLLREINIISKKMEADVTVRNYKQVTASEEETNKVYQEIWGVRSKIEKLEAEKDQLTNDTKMDPNKKKARLDEIQTDLSFAHQDHWFLTDILTARIAFKSLFHKVLDKAQINAPTLERLHLAQEAFPSIIRDLDIFKDTSSVLETANIKTVKAEVEFAQKITYDVENLNNIDPKQREPTLKAISEEIIKKCEALSPSEQGVIFPGGFTDAQGGHAMLFNIQMNENGKYSLTVIDTLGDGYRLEVEPRIFNGLTKDDLTPDLISTMIDYTRYQSASEMNRVIDNKIMATGEDGVPKKKHIQELQGTPHRVQRSNTCTVQCVLAWLERRLPPEQFNQFEKRMTATAIYDAEEAGKKLTDRHKLVMFGEKDFSNVHIAKIFEAAREQQKQIEEKGKKENS